MSLARGTARMFSTLVQKYREAHPPAQLEVKLHKRGEQGQSIDFGYNTISLKRALDGTYSVSEQQQGHVMSLGKDGWYDIGPSKLQGAGLSFAEALRAGHKLQEKHLREIDETGRGIWTLHSKQDFQQVGQVYNIPMNPFYTAPILRAV